jgi:hypothetical protein
MDFRVARFEEKSDSLFICLVSDHVQIEHFFSEDERLDRTATIERLCAELSIAEDEWRAPEPVVNRLIEVQAIVLDRRRIDSAKSAILLARSSKKSEEFEAKSQPEDIKGKVERPFVLDPEEIP